MTVEERKARKREYCFDPYELYEFFNIFYDMSSSYKNNDIVREREYSLYKSDISMTLKSFTYREEDLVHEINMKVWKDWPKNDDYIKFEYTYYYNGTHSNLYEWFMITYNNDSNVKIVTKLSTKDSVLEAMLNFIIKKEAKHYDLPLPLLRELKLNKLLI